MTRPSERLRYRDGRGRQVEAKVVYEGDDPAVAPVPLHAVRVLVEPDASARPHAARMLRVPPGGPRPEGYELLDNETLAGLRLWRVVGGGHYPAEVSRLIGFEPDSAEPYVLLEPYQGDPVAEIAGDLLPRDRLRFQLSLLTGLRWLAAAGIAHRGLSPYTVRWDGEHVQIIDFSLATLAGAPRTVIGAPPWWAPEQRPGSPVGGEVSDRDDIWAAARLIHYVITGRELQDRADLDEVAELAPLRDRILGPPDGRPTARELLQRLGGADPVPRGVGADTAFEQGRAEFFAHRRRKHPDAPPVAGFDEPEPPPPRAEPPRVPSEPVRPVPILPAAGAAVLGLLLIMAVLIRVLGG